MEDRRRLSRHTVLKSAKIMFNNQSSLVDCTVCNLTSDGACLHFATTAHIPELFELSFDNFRSARACSLVWRQADRFGVCFC